MKRLLAVVLAISLVFSASGCAINFDAEAFFKYAGDQISQNFNAYVDDAISNAEEEVANWFDDLWDTICFWKTSPKECDHTPKQYIKKENIIICECEKYSFASVDLPELSYKTFESYINWWDLDTWFKDKDKYAVEAFLKFKGVNNSFFNLLDAVDLDGNYSETLSNPGKMCDFFENTNVAGTVYVNFIGSADLIEEKGKFDETFQASLLTVNALVHLHKMLDANDNPYDACDEFIATIKEPIGTISGTDGVLVVAGLESLQTVLDAYKVGYVAHLKEVDYTGFASQDGNGQFITWDDLRLDENKWKLLISFEHIMGIEKREGTNLPSLSEILAVYSNFSIEGKAYASQYILFCLDYIFEETLGISYDEYINYLGNEES